MEAVGQEYSPSNYTQSHTKPDTYKQLESPMRPKLRKSTRSRSLFKRLLGSSPSVAQRTGNSIDIGVGQTVSLSERRSTDSVSQLSIDIPQTSPDTGYSDRSSNQCSSIDSIQAIEPQAIEDDTKVIDVMSPITVDLLVV